MALQGLAACLLGASLLTGQQSAQALDPSAKRRDAFIGYSERHRDSINLQTSHGQVGGLLMCSPPDQYSSSPMLPADKHCPAA